MSNKTSECHTSDEEPSDSTGSLADFIASDDDETYSPSTAQGSTEAQWLDIIDDIVFRLDGLRTQIELKGKASASERGLSPPPRNRAGNYHTNRSNAPSPAEVNENAVVKDESDSDIPLLRSRFRKIGLK
ncbi:hypothetical protein Purlil1_14269 [Purpureocillium lilacinum]|uniref:Uncharacterized protein n=1 Tax=Purpureocillium lilacinum TaxID=33203 RepID=A0ABR0BBI0_PURLI|nr:hypothetical protein Purlil1_14366 [Purpureocillium lilacinum]KAK4061147.1 hypothetical protein Purlil1_14269 [Purpureocillium lilacinum]